MLAKITIQYDQGKLSFTRIMCANENQDCIIDIIYQLKTYGL